MNVKELERDIKGRNKPRIVDGKLHCSRCNSWKPVEDFPSRGTYRDRTKRYGYCKPCHVAYQSEKRLTWVHNITPQEADAILAWQKGVCAICLQPQSAKKIRFAVDHDHKTGFVRGRLCSYCNRIIAMFHDKPEKLERAANYLRNPPARQVIGDRIVQRTQREGIFERSKDHRMFSRKHKSRLPDKPMDGNPPSGSVQLSSSALPLAMRQLNENSN